MNFDLNIILLIFGSIISLGAFAIKVGFGLGFGKVSYKNIILTYIIYFIIFVILAISSQTFYRVFMIILKKGVYMHALMSVGLILWGSYAIKNIGCSCRYKHHTMLLLLPCPVCITAIGYSTWAASSIVKINPFLTGIGMGVIFISVSFMFFIIARIQRNREPSVSLGLSMIGIGLYFLAALIIPSKIEEGKQVFYYFVSDNKNIIILQDLFGVILILSAAFLAGFIVEGIKNK